MNALLEQLPQPQNHSTAKKKRIRHQKSTGTRKCICGHKKHYCAEYCSQCAIKSRRSPDDPNVYIIEGKPCKRIALTNEKWAIVDEEDYERINKWFWSAAWSDGCQDYYAFSTGAGKYFRGTYTPMAMTAMILNLPPGTRIDHKNGNSLYNTKSNLRPATASQNSANRGPNKNTRSEYLGVYFMQRCPIRPWGARLSIHGKTYCFGQYATPEEAAYARDLGALKHFKEFAWLNFPEHKDEYLRTLSGIA
jgi:hypothetical protein